MAFDRTYFSQVHVGGAGANSVWFYHDYNADNIASLAGPGVNTAYFSRAYDDHGIKARAGDLIMISSFHTKAVNAATPCMALVPNDWDGNGATVIVTGSAYLYTH